jgi:PTH1 family peptidyl-tRNA hydrolase
VKCFVGLGNPGSDYARTRHNVGFMAIDRFADKHGFGPFQRKCKGLLAEGSFNGMKVYLLKPQTYMNLSGESVRACLDFYKADMSDLIVVYDDLDTNFGSIRLRYQGSSGGQNGIKSIIGHVGTQSFNRIRIGISRPMPGKDPAAHVLSPFAKTEAEGLNAVLDRVCEAMEFAVSNEFEKTMAKFN